MTSSPETSPGGMLGAFSRVKGPLSAVLGLACVAYLGHVLWSRRESLARTLELDWLSLGGLLLLVFASHLQRIVEFDAMLRRLGVRETFRQGFLLTGAVALLNYLPFSAGSVTRALALRRLHALSYTRYTAALMIATIVNAVVAALVASLAVLGLRSGGASEGAPLFAFLGVIVALGVLVLVLPESVAPRGQSRVQARLRDLVEALALIRQRGGLALLTATSLAKLLLNALRMWICFRALGVELSALEVALLGTTIVLGSLVNLAPGNLGVRELLLAGVWGLVSGSPTLGVAAASLDRAVWMAYTLVAGLPGIAHVRVAFTPRGGVGDAHPVERGAPQRVGEAKSPRE